MLAIWAGLMALSALTLYEPEQRAELRIGMLKTVDAIHPLIAEENGFYSDEGLNVSVRTFGTSPALAEAVASGEIDVAYMSVVPAGIWRTKGTDIVILAGASRGGDMVCTREGSRSGKIAVSGRGTMTEVLYSGYVAPKFDYEPVSGIEPADMPTALLVTKDVDAAFVWEPFASEIEKSGGTCIFDTGAEWEKEKGEKYQRNVLVASGKVAKDPILVQRLLRVNSRTIAFLNQNGSGEAVAEAMNIEPLAGKRVEYNDSLDWESMAGLWGMAEKLGYMDRVPAKGEIVYGG
ncbi:MAG TPA: ABC transporter substrate-binding protein [Candidatus Bilamarchaeum sp.]|nr:ABC transporter substrate-binding protein [Candidatus Bilamarchaeum sp.]